MEGLKSRIVGLVALFVVAGIATQLMAYQGRDASKNEKWLEGVTATSIPGYELQHSPENPNVSYRMDKMTYDTLNPYGIVARVFNSPQASVDTVIIASQADDSFHDPRQCFTSQFWELQDQQTILIDTQTRGKIPATIVNLKGRDRNSIAVFCYKGPGGFFASTMGLKFDMLKYQLTSAQSADGVFYRFIAQGTTNRTQLLKFIGEYMDESNRASKGVM